MDKESIRAAFVFSFTHYPLTDKLLIALPQCLRFEKNTVPVY